MPKERFCAIGDGEIRTAEVLVIRNTFPHFNDSIIIDQDHSTTDILEDSLFGSGQIRLRQRDFNIQDHCNFLLINHYIRYLEHGGKVILQINHTALAAGEGHQRDVFHLLKFPQDPANCGLADPPALRQIIIADEGTSCPVTDIDNRTDGRSFYLGIVVDRGYP